MASGITNFQYVGYLGDFLHIYNNIDKLTEEFNCAKRNYEAAQECLKSYENRFSLINCLAGMAIVSAVIALITSPILIFAKGNIFFWLLFCVTLSFVIILVSKILYNKRILPDHRAHLTNEAQRAKASYRKAYQALVELRSALNKMKDGVDERCTFPLSIYIMREAAKEGECTNIPQGIRYFVSRYRTLENSLDNKELAALKQSIDQERHASEVRVKFLELIDEQARTLFDE